MPQVAAFAATAVAKAIVGFSALKATTIGSLVIKAATITALSAASAALAPQVGAGGSPRQGLPDVNAPIHIASGRFGASGRPVWRHETWGKDNRLWTQAIVLAGAGPIKSLQTFKLDDVTVPISGGVATGRYADALWMDTQLGAQPESSALAPPTLPEHGSPSGWGGSNKLSGKAAYMLTMVQNKEQNRFVGPLLPMWTGEGCYTYDPRLDSTYPGGSGSCRLDTPSTWVWTECPALHALKWALGHWEDPTGKGAPGVGKLVCGMGVKPEGIDFASFVNLANVRDANGWKVSAWPSSADSPKQVLDAYLQAAGAIYADINGKLGCISRGAPQTASITVTPADLAGPVELDRQSSLIDRQNTLTPRFMSEANGWQLTPLDPITDPDWRDDDNGDERGADYDLPFVRDKDQAGQLTYLAIAHTREPIRGTAPLRPYMSHIKPGTRFTFDAPGSDLEEVKCLCLQAQYDPKAKTWTVSFVSETDAKYTKAGTVSPDAPAPSTYDPPDRLDPDPPTSDEWTLTGGVVGTGVTQPALIIEGEADNAYASRVLVDYRKDGATDWIATAGFGADGTRFEITGVEAEEDYEVRLRYLTRFGAISDALILGPVTTGGLTAGSADEVPWTGVQNRPTELTDGRIAAGLDSDGRLATGVTPFDRLSGRTADRMTYVGGGGASVESLRPAAAGADPTASNNAAGVIGGGALLWLDAVGASRMLAKFGPNLVPDPLFEDEEFWSLGAGWAFDTTSTAILEALGTSKALRSALGNGTTSQGSTSGTFAAGQFQAVIPGQVYKPQLSVYMPSGYSGRMRFGVVFHEADGTQIGGLEVLATENHRTSALGSATTKDLSGIVTAPAGARLIRMAVVTDWGTTIASSGAVWMALPSLQWLIDADGLADDAVQLDRHLVDELGTRLTRTNIAAASRSAGVNPNATHRQSNGNLSAMSGQPEKVSAEDGVPVTFANTHAAPPLVIPIYDNLDAPAANEYLRMRADDLTTTGFTPVIEWVEPPTSPTYAARSDDTPAVTGPAQTLERQKALNGVAYDGEYIARGKFKAEGNSVGIGDPEYVTIGFYGRQTSGGAWTLLGTSVGLVADGLVGSGLVKNFTIIGNSAWATWNVHGNTEYRIMMTGGYFAGRRELTEFTSVTYTEQTGGSGGGSRPALSNDRTAPFSVIPVGA